MKALALERSLSAVQPRRPNKGARSKFGVILLTLMILVPERISLLGVDPGDSLSGDPLSLDPSLLPHVLVWVAASMWVLWTLSFSGFRLPSLLLRPPLRWYALFSVVALLSTAYSLNPPYTLFFAGKLVTIVLLVALLAGQTEDPGSLMRQLIGVLTVQWVVIAVFYFIRPETVGVEVPGIGYRLTGGVLFGDYGHSALVAGLGFLSKILFSYQRPSRFVAYSLLYVATLYFVSLSRTRSTFFAAVLVFLIMLLWHPRARLRLAGIVTLWAGVCVGFWLRLDQYVIDFVLRGQDVDALLGLSGRDELFTFYLAAWRDSPLLGYGFHAGSRVFGLAYMSATDISLAAAHDSLSKALIDLGVVGFVLLAVAFLSGWKTAVKLKRMGRRAKLAPVEGLQIVALMAILTSSSIVSGGIAEVSIVFVIVMVSTQLGIQRLRETADYNRPDPPHRGQLLEQLH